MKKKVPGPGSYAARSTLDARGKSLAKRLPGPKSTADSVPGPGSYDQPNSRNNLSIKSAPNWRIGTASRDDELRVKRRVCNFPSSDTYNAQF
jgi:hypothetical protein